MIEEEINTLYNLLSLKQRHQLKKYAIHLIQTGLEPITYTKQYPLVYD